MKFKSMLNKIFGTIDGRTDDNTFTVTFDDPRCSYGQPVLLLSELDKKIHPEMAGKAFGPGDVGGLRLSQNHEHRAALIAAGFRCCKD